MGILKPGTKVILLIEKKIKHLLSYRNAGRFIVALIIVTRVLQQLYFFNPLTDLTYQILAARHFLDGHGISFATILASDMSQVIYEPLTKWPPGYSFLFIPFYLLLGKNYILTALFISIGAALLLIFFCRAILKTLGTPYYLINLFTLLSGFFGYQFYNLPCTDSIGITFFIIAINYTLLLLKNNEKATRNILIITISLIICGFIKYLFIPAIFTIPVFLLVKGIADKNVSLKKTGLFSLAILAICFTIFFLFQNSISGTMGYINQSKRGLYPENLQAMFPFITGSFLKPDSFSLLMPEQGRSYIFLYHTFQIISLIVFFVIFFIFFNKIIKKGIKKTTLTEDYFFLSVIISSILLFLLALLSLKVAKEPRESGQFWTYVQEARYYGIITVFLQMGTFVLYPVYRTGKKLLIRLVFPFLLLLMVPEMVRGAVFTSHRIQRFNKEKYGWQQELQLQKFVNKILNNKKQTEKNKNMVVAGSNIWMTYRISLYSKLPVFSDVNKLNDLTTLKTSKPVTIFVLIEESHMDAFKHFTSSADVQPEGYEFGFYFYTYHCNQNNIQNQN